MIESIKAKRYFIKENRTFSAKNQKVQGKNYYVYL